MKSFQIFFLLFLSSLPFVHINAVDQFTVMTIPKSGSHLLTWGILPIIAESGAPPFFHTGNLDGIRAQYGLNSDHKGVLCIRIPEDVILSWVKFMDKKAAYGNQTPVHHRVPQKSTEAWKRLPYKEKCMCVALDFRCFYIYAMALFDEFHPFLVRYEDIIEKKTRKVVCKKLTKYLHAPQLTREKQETIEANVKRPLGWVYRKGVSGEGAQKLPEETIQFIRSDATYQAFMAKFYPHHTYD